MTPDPSDRPEAAERGLDLDLDLVEYIVIAVPDLASVAGVAEALRRLVRLDRMRILDLVAVVASADGGDVIVEPEAVAGMAVLGDVDGEVGGLLTDDDIAMACSELPVDTAAVLLVLEDRWAGELAGAARTSGGQIVGGERVPRHRVEAASGPHRFREADELPTEESPREGSMRRVADTREGRPGLLARRPWIDRSFRSERTPGVNLVDQLRELVELYDRGLLSTDEFARQRAKLLPP